MATAGTVTVDFAAETAKFTAELKKVRGELEDLKGGFETFQRVAEAALGFLAVDRIVEFVKGAAEAADQLGKMSDKLNISTQKLTAFQLAANQAGVSTETMNKLLLDAQRRLGDAANGTGEAGRTIQELGLKVSDLQKLSPDELFLKYADAIGKLTSRSDQLSAAQTLFGKSAQEAFTIIAAGRPAIEEAEKQVNKLGLALDRVPIKQIEDANDKLGLLAKASQVAGQQIAASLAPFVSAFADSLINSGVSVDSLKEKLDEAVAVGYFAFQTLRNGALVLESAFYGLAAAGARVLQALTFGDLSESFKASVNANLAAARNALDQIKTFAQISEQYSAILENSRQKAEEAVAAQQNATSGTGGGQDVQLQTLKTNLAYQELAYIAHNQILLDQQQIYNDASLALQQNLDASLTEQARIQEQRRQQIVVAAEAAISRAKQSTFNAALGLLQALSARSKAAAIAAIALNKGLSIALAIQNGAVAFTKALAEDPTGVLAARVALLTKIQVALIAATGLAEVSNVLDSSGSGASLGSPSNPVFTDSNSADRTFGATSQNATQITINGYIGREQIDQLVNALKDEFDHDVVIINGTTRQAQELLGG